MVQIELSIEDGRQEADRDPGEPDSDEAAADIVEDLSRARGRTSGAKRKNSS